MSDRHVHSYEIIRNYAEKNKNLTLVLFDAHNDAGKESDSIKSYNWAGELVRQGYIKKIIWVAGKSLNEMEKISKEDWLKKNLAGNAQKEAELIFKSFEITDLDRLKQHKIKGKIIISVDFDFFSQIENADDALLQTAAWIARQKCSLVTLAFSAAYQIEPKNAWHYLECFAENYKKNAEWLFQSGLFNEKPESLEDIKAWNLWYEKPGFYSFGGGFHRGAHLWINAPESVQKVLLTKKIAPFDKKDETSVSVLETWKNSEYAEFKQKFTETDLMNYKKIAVDALKETLKGKKIQPVYSSSSLETEKIGVAVRFKTKQKDRGCLALYCGIKDVENAIRYCAFEAADDPRYEKITEEELSDLYVNICIFSSWTKMKNPFDFVPGFDSLIMDNKEAVSPDLERTLLQSAVAAENAHGHEEFLQRLCIKARLKKDAFKTENSLEFYKSPTISFWAKVIE